jgi:hypothetical protein
MTKALIIQTLPEIKKIIQLAYEGDICGRLIEKEAGMIQLRFYANKYAFEHSKEREGNFADLILTMHQDKMWTALKYGIVNYGTSSEKPKWGYYMIPPFKHFDSPITSARAAVEYINAYA